MAESNEAADKDRLPAGRLTAQSLMTVPIAGAQLPLGTYLPAIYAQHFGMSLYALGAIFLGERIWGTLTDPLVGWLCDRTKSRFGRRKVWIAAGVALFAISYFVLFFPFAWMSPLVLTVALIVLFLAWSMIVIPYYAWSGELSGNYHERTRVTTYQTVTGAVSLVVILLVPALVDYFRPDSQLLKLNAMGAVVLIPLLPITILTLRSFPDKSVAPVRNAKVEKLHWRETLRAVMAEKTTFKVMLADFAIVFAQGTRGGLFIFYVGFVLGRPNLAATLFLFQFLFGILAAPIWQAIAKRIGKHKAVIATELIQAAINLPLIFLGANDIALFMALAVVQGLTQGSGNLILRAMLADVADEYRLRTGLDRTAMLFSAFSVSGKAGSAIPLGVALPLIAWFGFDPSAATNPSTGLMALALTFGLAPCLTHLAAAWLIRGFDIDEAKQVEVRRQLEELDAKAAEAG
ncbi:MAG: MFS transporter [Novosphingobium sp.]|nr:MFS transporter [Novosphingobium sp.]